jgi:RimJ/RimL family protein N-acetyltransferase
LRPFRLDDAAAVQRLASAREIAEMTLNIPHPYPDGAAEAWITASAARDDAFEFAIVASADGSLVGAIGLALQRVHSRAELGYWIGVPYWGCGYATEAAGAVLEYAFATLELHRVYAIHYSKNPASGRVLQKLGMTHEGRQRGHVLKWGEYLDEEVYGILRDEWQRET